MPTRYFALAVGVIYLLVGLMGFIPGLVSAPEAGAPDLIVEAGYGRLLGIFPVNVLHHLVHILIGVLGIVAYRSWPAARTFARGLAIFYGLLAIGAFIPGLRTTFGLIPIYGIADFLLHAVTAAIAAYFGFAAPAETATTTARTTRGI
jgi:hypothetical protein